MRPVKGYKRAYAHCSPMGVFWKGRKRENAGQGKCAKH